MHSSPSRSRIASLGALVTGLILLATIAQLVVATVAGGALPQFAGKAFGARLVAYPLLMLLVPALWWWTCGRRGVGAGVPWAAFALLMAPFLIDVTGNTLNLYDSVTWWDDLNHFVNWILLSSGLGLLMARRAWSPAWGLGLAVGGVGALLAVGWELGEWYTFIRDGTELDDAYEDTLADQALGTLGGVVAAVGLSLRARRQR